MKIGNLKQYLFVGLIVLVAFLLRIYKVDKIPPSLSWDEVSIGYNAYTILKTGRDEHQRFLPFDYFAAYGDYKPPLPIYLTVPAVAIFGLNELAVRLPSVIFGTLTVLFLFFLARQLLPRAPNIAWFATLALSFSPWHINLSRAAFEANLALFFIILGAYLVLISQKIPKLLLFCWMPLVASVYTFNSARYFAPLFAAGLLIYSWKSISKKTPFLIAGILLSLVLMLPIMPHLLSKEARLRFHEVNIFTDASVVATANERIAYDGNVWWAKIVHNRRLGYARSYLIHFFDNLELRFLFVKGDGNPKFSIQDVGQLYLADLPFLILGIYLIFSKERKVGWLLLYWLVTAIAPAATARETPHALRIENGLPVFMIFLATGFYETYRKLKEKLSGKMILWLILSLYIFNLLYYLHNYYIHYPWEYSGEWQYGYREAVAAIKSRQTAYDQIVITESIGRPYMYVLFYEHYDPAVYWKTVQATFDAAGFYNVYGFDKFRFVRTGIGELQKKTLYVLNPSEIPANARILASIKELNGTPVLAIFDIP